MNRTVVQIVGTGYCGSSLLNVLLNSQPDICGIGEAHYLYNPGSKAWCICTHYVKDCPFFKQIDTKNFYRDCLSAYGCSVLVDASKDQFFFSKVADPTLQYVIILLSKSPHEFAYSVLQHKQRRGSGEEIVKKAFADYIQFYKRNLASCASLPYVILPITYQHLVLSSPKTIRFICEQCGVPFSAEALTDCFKTDTHMVCGNSAVGLQIQKQKSFFEKEGKYKGKYQTIFLDDAWKHDLKFIDQCLPLYEKHKEELESLLPRLGQPAYTQILAPLIDTCKMFTLNGPVHERL